MAVLLFLWGIFAILYGLFALLSARSAIHEIQAGVAFLIATISIGFGALLGAISDIRSRLKKPDGAESSTP